MNKTNYYPFWIGLYFGQNCIYHIETGMWTLTGYFDGQVVCKKLIGTIDEDCELFPIGKISFKLKEINPHLLASLCNTHSFIIHKAKDGYWMFSDSNVNVILEKENVGVWKQPTSELK